MINSAPDLFGFWLPADAMIKGTSSKKGNCCKGKYAQRYTPAEFVSESNEY
jgi:hypothetical protein